MGLFKKLKKSVGKTAKPSASKSTATQPASSAKKTSGSQSQSDEAKKVLEKMKAKKDAGDCAFC